MSLYQQTRTNHKWNVLNIMRYYTRINKPFNATVYTKFIGANGETSDELRNTAKVPVPVSTISLIIRRYISNGWAVRKGENVVITPKGTLALEKHEEIKYKRDSMVDDETLRRRNKRRY
jgi:hypothetical protein